MSVIPITALPRQLASTVFMTGNIPTSALQSDPRFQYAAYIPDAHYPQSKDDITKLPVLVTLHGSSRTHLRYLNIWRDFADSQCCAIVAPLFPAFVAGPTDIEGYHFLGKPPVATSPMYAKLLKKAVDVPNVHVKIIESGAPRHDLLLVAMLDELALRWPALDVAKVMLAGFSGGAQFAHRFAYLHPQRLLAVSVGAPGSVTDLDYSKPWPAGVQDVEAVFGRGVDVEALKRVPLLAVVGAEDIDGSRQQSKVMLHGGTSGAGDEANKTRVQKLRDCVGRWRGVGLSVELQIIPSVKHEMEGVHAVVESFMVKHITDWQKLHV